MQSFFKSQLGMVVCAVTATFLWGSAFPFIKKSYVALDIAPHEWGEQLLFAGYRFFLSGIMIFLFYGIFRRGSMKYKKNSFSTVLQVGLLMTFLQYVFFYIGLSHSTGIQGSIMAGTATFFQVF